MKKGMLRETDARQALALKSTRERNMPLLNDVHSQLNETEVARVVAPATAEEVGAAIAEASAEGLVVCPAGSLHSMGGQQFAGGGVSLSTSRLKSIGPLDAGSATVWVQAGVTWAELVEWLRARQGGQPDELTIIQKQTGADEMTLGGALSSNIHGRVLGRRPIVDDIEAFYITRPGGERLLCSRTENAGLFSAAIGGYGLFGVVDAVQLRLEPRRQLARRVRELPTSDVIQALEEQMRLGATYGDFQYMTDETSADFMDKGVLSTYAPTGAETTIPEDRLGLSVEDWMRLYVLAHTNKAQAYTQYAAHYLRTDGQVYWSDEHQFSPYLPEAGRMLAQSLDWSTFASLMISELYVPRQRFGSFMSAARRAIVETEANLVYGTVRLIEAEEETALRWAKRDYACIIFNLLVEHSVEGIERARAQFRTLIDCALDEDGCYYLTYHRWASRDQLERAYPEIRSFLDMKDRYDPGGVFDSEWHRALRRLLRESKD